MTEGFLFYVKVVLLAIILVIWGVVGFIFWIPFLARMIAMFSAAVLHASLTGGNTNALQEPLEFAMRFYIKGFQMSIQTLLGDNESGSASSGIGIEIGFEKIFIHTLWTFVFWLLALLPLYLGPTKQLISSLLTPE